MSPSWRERVQLTLAPSGVELARYGRGFRPALIASAAVRAEPGESAADVFARALADTRWHRADTRIVLSGHLVRYQMLPWSAALATDADRLAYARLEFAAVHGDKAQSWDLALADAPAGAAAPVCAIDAALIASLKATCTGATLSLVSVTPRFVAEFDRVRQHIARGPGGFALVEPGRLTLGLFDHGRWRALSNPRFEGPAAAALAAELTQAQALGTVGVDGARLHVVFAGAPDMLPAKLAGWDVMVHDGAAPAVKRPHPRRIVGAGRA